MIMDYIVGHLDQKYCIYFSTLSIYGLSLLIILFIFIALYPSVLKTSNYTTYIFYILISFMIYFQNRLLYNMCINKIETLESDIPSGVKPKNSSNDKIMNEWNKQFVTVQKDMNIIDQALNVIKKNTEPLKYKTVKNIINK